MNLLVDRRAYDLCPGSKKVAPARRPRAAGSPACCWAGNGDSGAWPRAFSLKRAPESKVERVVPKRVARGPSMNKRGAVPLSAFADNMLPPPKQAEAKSAACPRPASSRYKTAHEKGPHSLPPLGPELKSPARELSLLLPKTSPSLSGGIRNGGPWRTAATLLTCRFAGSHGGASVCPISLAPRAVGTLRRPAPARARFRAGGESYPI